MITQSFHHPQGGVALDFQPQDLVAPLDGCEIKPEFVKKDYEQTWFNLYLPDGNFWQFVHCIPTKTGKFKKGEVFCTPYRGVFSSETNKQQKGKPYPSHIHAAANIQGKWVNILSTIEPSFELTTSELFSPLERREWSSWSKYQPKSFMSKKEAVQQIKETHLITSPERRQAIINAINGDDWSYAVWDLLNQAGDYQRELKNKTALLEQTEQELQKNRENCCTSSCFGGEVKHEENTQKPDTNNIEELRRLLAAQQQDSFDWGKIKLGLAKYAWAQSFLGILIVCLFGYVLSFIPELEPYKSDILSWLFTLFGISALGQNSKQVLKSIKL